MSRIDYGATKQTTAKMLDKDYDQPLKQYWYRDMVTNKRKFTRGKFAGWTVGTRFGRPVAYAIFVRKASELFVPEWCLGKLLGWLRRRTKDDWGKPIKTYDERRNE